MQFEVPQFIEIEDKIFGPFTWRQFFYIAGGVGASVVAYLLLPLLLAVLIIIPIAGLVFALSFYPVNNRPFSFFVEAVYNYIMNQKLYLWRQNKEVVYKSKFAPGKNPTASRSNPVSTNRAVQSKNISSLARKLELEAMKKEI